jgi:DNA-binding transcriptional MocR family regulator
MITSGCQQALDLVRRVLIRPGDKVLLEEPVYPGLKNLFLEAGAELTGIPVQADGMETAQIERAIARAGSRRWWSRPIFKIRLAPHCPAKPASPFCGKQAALEP